MTSDSDSKTEPNWLDWSMQPSEAAVKQMAEWAARDKRVGVLLREMHYLATSKPPYAMHLSRSEEAYWTGSARNSPGLDESRVRAELTRRKTGFSTSERHISRE